MVSCVDMVVPVTEYVDSLLRLYLGGEREIFPIMNYLELPRDDFYKSIFE